MNDNTPDDVSSRTRDDTLGDRVICVVARDILSLERRDIGLDGLLTVVWRGRWLMLAFVLVFGLAALVYSYVATKWYVAQTVLIPVTRNDVGGLGSQLGNLAMLTSLAGINLQEGNNTDESLGVLHSHDFARQFIEDQKLLHLFFWKDWDAEAARWKDPDPRHEPDIRDAIRYFDQSILIVNEDRKTGLVTLGIRWKDPVLAAAWANMIVERLNAEMRAHALTEGEANIEYLRKEMSSTTQMDVQVAIAQLIETELQKTMIASSNKEFAFRVIDHAEVPKIRAWPKRGVVTVLGVFAGGLLGLMAIFTKDVLKRLSRGALAG